MNIAQNPKVRKLLNDRWKELSLKPSHIMDDAMEREPNMKFSRSVFSRWKHETLNAKGQKVSWLTDNQMIWLCTRWGIEINLNFGTPYINKIGGLAWRVLPYNELDCIKNIKALSLKVADAPVKKPKKVAKKK